MTTIRSTRIILRGWNSRLGIKSMERKKPGNDDNKDYG